MTVPHYRTNASETTLGEKIARLLARSLAHSHRSLMLAHSFACSMACSLVCLLAHLHRSLVCSLISSLAHLLLGKYERTSCVVSVIFIPTCAWIKMRIRYTRDILPTSSSISAVTTDGKINCFDRLTLDTSVCVTRRLIFFEFHEWIEKQTQPTTPRANILGGGQN